MVNVEREKVILKIKALLDKTPENGCTRDEALKAAEKAGELMAFYNIAISDISELDNEKMVELSMPLSLSSVTSASNGKNRSRMDTIAVALADFCGVKCWFSGGRHRSTESVHKFFGYESDIAICEYLYRIIAKALISETENFKKSDTYKNFNGHRRSATISFQRGFANRMYDRLRDMEQENAVMTASTSVSMGDGSTSLVMVEKQDRIEAALKQMGVKFKKRYSYSYSYAQPYHAGKDAANNVGLRNAVNSGNNTLMIG